jgi:two-component system, LytTR family, response regulator
MLLSLGKHSNVDTGRILFLKSYINYTEFNFLDNMSVISAYSLKKYEYILEKYNFKRVHRSYIVNMDYVILVSGSEIHLSNGSIVPVSRRRRRMLH